MIIDLPNEKVLFLSDIFPTDWHATELGEISASKTVAIWGCGPVEMLAVLSAQYQKKHHELFI